MIEVPSARSMENGPITGTFLCSNFGECRWTVPESLKGFPAVRSPAPSLQNSDSVPPRWQATSLYPGHDAHSGRSVSAIQDRSARIVFRSTPNNGRCRRANFKWRTGLHARRKAPQADGMVSGWYQAGSYVRCVVHRFPGALFERGSRFWRSVRDNSEETLGSRWIQSQDH